VGQLFNILEKGRPKGPPMPYQAYLEVTVFRGDPWLSAMGH